MRLFHQPDQLQNKAKHKAALTLVIGTSHLHGEGWNFPPDSCAGMIMVFLSVLMLGQSHLLVFEVGAEY